MDLNVNHLFFEKHSNEYIKDAAIAVSMNVDWSGDNVSVALDIDGKLTSICDVCLEELVIPVQKHETLILKTTGKAKERDDENIVFIGEGNHSYNIEQALYEYIVSAIPIRKDHKEIGTGECNPEMLKLIEKAKQKPLFKEDERWAALKNLKLG